MIRIFYHPRGSRLHTVRVDGVNAGKLAYCGAAAWPAARPNFLTADEMRAALLRSVGVLRWCARCKAAAEELTLAGSR